MPDSLLNIAEIDERLVVVRANLTESIEQAAAYSGAADEELYAERISEYEAELKTLSKRRDELVKRSAAQTKKMTQRSAS